MKELLTKLKQLPDGFQDADQLINDIDQCFLSGFARLNESQKGALSCLAKSFSGSPLGESIEKAVSVLLKGAFDPADFALIAAARSALQGAQYDAIQASWSDALGRQCSPNIVYQYANESSPITDSVGQWLTELAIHGFKQLESETVEPFIPTCERLQDDPELVRESIVLTGFIEELNQSTPIAKMDNVPIRRWVDIWSKAMLLCYRKRVPLQSEKVTGNLNIMAVDIRQYSKVISLVFYVLLNEEALKRVQVTSYKTDSIVKHEIWNIFADYPNLIEALHDNKSIAVKNMEILETGDIIWEEGKSSLGKEFDPMELAASILTPNAEKKISFPATVDTDKHPAAIGELIYHEGFSITKTDDLLNLDFGDESLMIDTLPFDGTGLIDAEVVEGAEKVVGILRFNDGKPVFRVLAAIIKNKKKLLFIPNGSPALGVKGYKVKGIKSTNSLEILQERASRLLRA